MNDKAIKDVCDILARKASEDSQFFHTLANLEPDENETLLNAIITLGKC